MYRQLKYILLFLFVYSGIIVSAQNKRDSLSREVEVTKSYTPTVSSANKLNSKAKIDEPEYEAPSFDYSIRGSEPVFGSCSVTPLKAATIETGIQEQKGFGLVRAGFGSYAKTYGEVFFNNLNSKNSVFGIHAKHLSSFGDIKLAGEDKVDAPFMNNILELYTKYTFKNSILSLNLDLKQDAFRYYGYPETAVPDTLLQNNQQVNYFGTKQSFFRGGIHINLDNPTAEMDENNVGFDFDYHYFGTKTDQREHFVNITAKINRPLLVGTGLLEAGIESAQVNEVYSDSINSAIGTNNKTIVFGKPSWYIGNNTANIAIGAGLWFTKEDNESFKVRITPNIRANWAPVPEMINIFAGLDGKYINNHYSKIAYENPYINPYLTVKNSMQRYRLYGGFDGKFSAKTAFKISGEYGSVKDHTFYYLTGVYYSDVSTTTNIVDNTFNVLYDDVDRVKLNAEIFHASSDKLNLLLSVNYYNYKMNEQEEAWNLPDWDANLSVTYKLTEQLSLSADLFLTGDRKSLIIQSPDPDNPTLVAIGPMYEIYNMEAIFDINAKANYRITNKLSVFVQANNLNFQKYEHWFGYPSHNFNILGGISYAF